MAYLALYNDQPIAPTIHHTTLSKPGHHNTLVTLTLSTNTPCSFHSSYTGPFLLFFQHTSHFFSFKCSVPIIILLPHFLPLLLNVTLSMKPPPPSLAIPHHFMCLHSTCHLTYHTLFSCFLSASPPLEYKHHKGKYFTCIMEWYIFNSQKAWHTMRFENSCW